METNMGKDNAKKTLGVLVGGIMDDFTISVCRGAVARAKELGMQSVVFPGKYIDRDLSDTPELMFEYQFNTVFSCARKENVDALLCTIGSIGSFTTIEGMKKLLRQYEGIPLILVGARIEGYLSVTFDNSKGIQDGLQYLVEHNQCRKIGIVSANRDNTDVQERERAAIAFLQERNLPFSEKMLVRGSYSRGSKEAYRKLLDENPDLDAVFCVNDDTALGFYEELKQRNIRPGKDIYVMGFDDTLAAAKANPSLSTIHASGSLLGREAVEMIDELFRGETVSNRVIPTYFIRRNSFGNITAGEQKERISEKLDPDSYFEDIFYRNDETMDAQETLREIRIAFKRFLYALENAALTEENTEEKERELFAQLDELLRKPELLNHADTNRLLSSLERIYQTFSQELSEERRRFYLRDIFARIYSRLVYTMDYEVGSIRSQEEKTNYDLKLFSRDILQFDKGNDQSYTSLLGNLGWLRIENAAVYVFKEPVTHLNTEKFVAPDEVYCKAFLEEQKVFSIPAIHQRMTMGQIFKHSKQRTTASDAYVLFPLFYNAVVYGMLYCDLTEELFVNGEFLVNQMSSAVRMIHLLHSNESIQQQLEDSLALLRKNNLELDSLSRSDPLTGLFNRRGFHQAAQEFMDKCHGQKENVLVCYIDMNNLKIVNDRYGHQEGDFSLTLISRLLAETVDQHGISGRIGGDEFACILKEDQTYPDAGAFKEKLYQRFDDFNKDSDKPYNVTVCTGSCRVAPGSTLTLKQALSLADEKLYEEKQKRKKYLLETLQKR